MKCITNLILDLAHIALVDVQLQSEFGTLSSPSDPLPIQVVKVSRQRQTFPHQDRRYKVCIILDNNVESADDTFIKHLAPIDTRLYRVSQEVCRIQFPNYFDPRWLSHVPHCKHTCAPTLILNDYLFIQDKTCKNIQCPG
jgi:hypothetical protein